MRFPMSAGIFFLFRAFLLVFLFLLRIPKNSLFQKILFGTILDLHPSQSPTITPETFFIPVIPEPSSSSVCNSGLSIKKPSAPSVWYPFFTWLTCSPLPEFITRLMWLELSFLRLFGSFSFRDIWLKSTSDTLFSTTFLGKYTENAKEATMTSMVQKQNLKANQKGQRKQGW